MSGGGAPPDDSLPVPVIRGKWPTMLAQMSDVLFSLFRRRGRSDVDASADAQVAVLELARFFGGRQWYMPTGKTLQTALRDDAIYRAFNGRNIGELATHHQIGERQIYEILRNQQALRRAVARPT